MRKKIGNEVPIVLAVKVRPETAEALRLLAKTKGLSISALLRKLAERLTQTGE